MDLQKVKAAMIAARNQMENDIISIDNDADISEMVQRNEMPGAWDMIVEQIVELEKPASENAMDIAAFLYGIDESTCGYEWHKIAAGRIQQYAESYAAKKCARVRLETLEKMQLALDLGNFASIRIVVENLIDEAKKEAVDDN